MNYKIDLFAVFIFLGIVQAAFLSFFFLSKDNRKVPANLYQGILLLSMAACILEIFLMYTGYIINCLYLVDFSEPIAFMIGPAFYLMILSLMRGPLPKKYLWHFAIPVVYFFTQLPFLILSEDVKYNAWIGAYHPDWPERIVSLTYDPDLFFITNHHTELVLLSLVVYGLLALVEGIKAFRMKNESFWRPVRPALKTLQSGLIQILSVVVLIPIVKLFNYNDTGDHFFAAYISITIYLTSFRVISQSGFFRQAPLNEQLKYKGSSVTTEQQQSILVKLKALMSESKPFLKPDFSLPELADQLRVSVHSLSQVINEGLGKSFFEMTAEYRIAEAQRLLIEKPNIKVEEIAEQVGYNSKSSFNTAFKKITSKTPSEFRAG